MLKKISFIFMVIALIVVITSCGSSSVDIWDGSVATSFAGGDGSAEKPYEISTGAELAYLAAQVNAGNTYDDTHFILTNDIDLNNLEWMPIGNGSHSFGGIFDGLQHTVNNLSLPYVVPYIVDKEIMSFTSGTTGLFGSCVDAVFRNLDIVGASVMTAEHEHMGLGMKIGVLCGYVTANTAVQFENIGIFDADITVMEDIKHRQDMSIGGICGFLSVDDDASAEICRVSVDISITTEKDNASNQNRYYGGIIGEIGNFSSVLCTDFDNTMTVSLEQNEGMHYVGSFGFVYTDSASGAKTSLKNGVSMISVDRSNCTYDYRAEKMTSMYWVETHPMIGTVVPNVWVWNNEATEYETGFIFENLYGYVNLPDWETRDVYIDELYHFPDGAMYLASRCYVCESLPDEHTLDPRIWDITDKYNPFVK